MMKPNFKSLCFLAMMFALPAMVEAQFTFTTNNGTITITKYTGSGGSVAIPSTIYGLPVSSIGDSAFCWKTSVTDVTIPNSVTDIGSYGFYGCDGLTNVIIGNGVTSIRDWAFGNCIGLTSITIPNSVTSIWYGAFENCTSLGGITVDATNSTYSSVEGVLFNKDQTTLIECPAGKAGSYVVPNSVISIGDSAFASCTALTNVIIGNSVSSIGESSFNSCVGMTSVTIPNTVTSIGSYAFSYCARLTSILFQGNAPVIGWSVFDSSFPTIYYQMGTSGWTNPWGGCQRRRQRETNGAVRNGSGTMAGNGNENGPADRSTGPCRL